MFPRWGRRCDTSELCTGKAAVCSPWLADVVRVVSCNDEFSHNPEVQDVDSTSCEERLVDLGRAKQVGSFAAHGVILVDTRLLQRILASWELNRRSASSCAMNEVLEDSPPASCEHTSCRVVIIVDMHVRTETSRRT